MDKNRYYIIPFFIALLVVACRKAEHYPPEPQITYKGFFLSDSVDPLGNEALVGSLIFSFIDGDGDLGQSQIDTIQPGDSANSNLFFTLYHMQNGTMVKAGKDEIKTPLNYRIPYISTTGKDKTLKGEIQVDFFYLNFPWDTIRYSFFLKDRAEHISNVEQSPVLFIPNH